MEEILVTSDPVSKSILQQMAERRFGDMVKGVVDLETGVVALGGELHADQEQVLIHRGHHQEGLWGFNIYIDEMFPENIEFDSLINIRPRQNNRSRYVEDAEIRKAMLAILGKIFND